jgi:hypothetical protein
MRIGGLAMSAVGLESIDHTVQLTHIWINELDTSASAASVALLTWPRVARWLGET